jgi:hypothetical protein
MKIARVFPVFSATFAVLYVLSIEYNLALITYHPQLNQWEFLVGASKGITPMFWYGWLATAALGGILAAAVASVIPSRWSVWLWSGWAWVVPLGAMAFIAYVLKDFFMR